MDVWDRVLAFMDAQALLTAHDRGIFERLADGPASGQAIARRAGLPEDSCVRLLNFLVALELVERQPDGSYANAAAAQAQLVSTSSGYIGTFLPYVRTVLYPAWGRLDAALEHAAPQCLTDTGGNAQDDMFHDPARLRGFLAGMHAITYPAARAVARASPELRALQHVVDVGGASGAFLIALAEEAPHQHGVVFDLPQVVAVAGEYIEQAGMSDRIETQGGDFWEDPLPVGADAYGLGFILHDWDEQGGDIILDKVASASRPGGTLIVGEHLLDDDRAGPRYVVRQDVNMLVSARGRERSRPEYAEWLRRHGFALGQTYSGAFGKQYMLARRI